MADLHTVTQEVRKILQLRIIPKESDREQFNYSCKDTPKRMRMPQCFMYDGLLFVVRLLGRNLVCRQYDTKVKTQRTVPKYSEKEFQENGLTLFIRAWRNISSGPNKSFDQTLLEYPTVIDTIIPPIPARIYHSAYCDIAIVIH